MVCPPRRLDTHRGAARGECGAVLLDGARGHGRSAVACVQRVAGAADQGRTGAGIVAGFHPYEHLFRRAAGPPGAVVRLWHGHEGWTGDRGPYIYGRADRAVAGGRATGMASRVAAGGDAVVRLAVCGGFHQLLYRTGAGILRDRVALAWTQERASDSGCDGSAGVRLDRTF